jgi:cob(I)alamin adenosyltransferase
MPHSQFYTRRGDDGTTGLLGPERVPKYDLRPEAYGTVDEAQAAMGLARAGGCTPRTAQILLAVQRDLHVLMAELAAAGTGRPSAAGIAAAQVDQLESWIAEVEAQVEMPREFVVPGDSRPGAALHLARTVVRRAERLAVRLADAELLDNAFLLHYLNRLSSLLFALACYEDVQATHHAATPANDQDPAQTGV